jgi:hypothetical protein
VTGGLFYLALFGAVAIGRSDREIYASVAAHLLHRPVLTPMQASP